MGEAGSLSRVEVRGLLKRPFETSNIAPALTLILNIHRELLVRGRCFVGVVVPPLPLLQQKVQKFGAQTASVAIAVLQSVVCFDPCFDNKTTAHGRFTKFFKMEA